MLLNAARSQVKCANNPLASSSNITIKGVPLGSKCASDLDSKFFFRLFIASKHVFKGSKSVLRNYFEVSFPSSRHNSQGSGSEWVDYRFLFLFFFFFWLYFCQI